MKFEHTRTQRIDKLHAMRTANLLNERAKKRQNAAFGMKRK